MRPWDPVFMQEDVDNKVRWWYYIETWADINGPFDTEEEARKDLKRYCVEELGQEVTMQTQPCIEGMHLLCKGEGWCECECHPKIPPYQDWRNLLPPQNTDEPLYKTLNPVEASTANILKVMHEAEVGGQHAPGTWTKQPVEEHFQHALDHMKEAEFILSLNDPPDIWESIEHAHCRLSMMLYQRERGL